MPGRIICFLCFLICAVPFWVIATYNKDSKDPISFWSGDTSLKDKVKNVSDYNREMAALYKKYAIAFFLAALAAVVHPLAGAAIMALDCTLGIFLVYRTYKKILNKYS